MLTRPGATVTRSATPSSWMRASSRQPRQSLCNIVKSQANPYRNWQIAANFVLSVFRYITTPGLLYLLISIIILTETGGMF